MWLLLHYADHTAPVDSFAQLKPLLKKYVPDYDKSRIDFETQYARRYPDAARRGAADLDPSGNGYKLNPSTNMWQLVRTISG